MAELKTKKNEASVTDFIEGVKDEQTRKDCLEIIKMMKQVVKAEPKMWGSSIVGVGERRLKYASGRELDWMILGLSPRKQNITLYLTGGLDPHKTELKKLGKHTTGKGCLYIKKLEDVDKSVLKSILTGSVKELNKK